MLRSLDFRHIRQYRIAPPLVVSWRTPGGGRVLLPRRGRLADFFREALAPKPPPEPGTAVLVAVQNASGKAGWDTLALWRLQRFGYATLPFPESETVLERTQLIPLHGQNLKQAAPLLRDLGLSREAFTPQPETAPPNIFADWFLRLGKDYDPCFVPAVSRP